MFGKLLPKETVFFDFFDQHAQITLQAAQLLLQLMSQEQILQHDPNPIKILEHQADQVTYHCIETLHKCFITPLQPDDIFRLISRMDDVMDAIDQIFEDCLIYKIFSFTPIAKEMAHLLVLAVEKLETVVKGLRDRKNQRMIMREANLQIHKIENEGDVLLRKALGQLFDEEQDLRLLIKWKEIYEVLEQAIDYCEDVSNIVEGIIMEYD